MMYVGIISHNCTVVSWGWEDYAEYAHGSPITYTEGLCGRRDYLNTMADQLRFLGSLSGHKGWVTAIATSSENPDMILTASRGTNAEIKLLIYSDSNS